MSSEPERSGFGTFIDERWPDLADAWPRMSVAERVRMIRRCYEAKHVQAIERNDLFGEGYYCGCADVLDALFGEGTVAP